MYVQRLDESELKLYVKQLQKQFVVAGKADAAQDDQVLLLHRDQFGRETIIFSAALPGASLKRHA